MFLFFHRRLWHWFEFMQFFSAFTEQSVSRAANISVMFIWEDVALARRSFASAISFSASLCFLSISAVLFSAVCNFSSVFNFYLLLPLCPLLPVQLLPGLLYMHIYILETVVLAVVLLECCQRVLICLQHLWLCEEPLQFFVSVQLDCPQLFACSRKNPAPHRPGHDWLTAKAALITIMRFEYFGCPTLSTSFATRDQYLSTGMKVSAVETA